MNLNPVEEIVGDNLAAGYLEDLLNQPAALHGLLDKVDESGGPAALDISPYDLVLITGMGGSHFANYYLWRTLNAAGVPVQWLSTDELISFESEDWLPERTLVWAVSQSGLSGELCEYLARIDSRPGIDVLAVTNNEETTPLTESATRVEYIHAGLEATVGTKTYTNTVALNNMLATRAIGGNTRELMSHYRAAADEVASYLASDWRGQLYPLAQAIGRSETFVLAGRGESHGTALEGALVLKEAANLHVEGLSVGQFRHGPFELADSSLFLWLLSGGGGYEESDESFTRGLIGCGTTVALTGLSSGLPGALEVLAPAGVMASRPVRHIVPIQLAAVLIAESLGNEPGAFRNSLKITTGI